MSTNNIDRLSAADRASLRELLFHKYQPDIKFDYHLKAPALGIPALCIGVADLAPSRHITFDETLMFERVFERDPVQITAVTGSLNVPGWNYALGIFVNKANPITKLTMT